MCVLACVPDKVEFPDKDIKLPTLEIMYKASFVTLSPFFVSLNTTQVSDYKRLAYSYPLRFCLSLRLGKTVHSRICIPCDTTSIFGLSCPCLCHYRMNGNRTRDRFPYARFCVCCIACTCLSYTASIIFVEMPQPNETENQDWLKSAPTASEEVGKSKEHPPSPTLRQERSRWRADTMSSVRSFMGLEPEAPIDEEHESLKHHGSL